MLKIDISTKNLTISDALNTFISEKIGSLDRYFKDMRGPIGARIEISKPSKHHRSGPIFYAEVNLKLGGRLLRAEAVHLDLRTAIVKVKNELQSQIKRFKEKGKDISRKSPL